MRLGNLLYIYGDDDGYRIGKLVCLGGNAQGRLIFWSQAPKPNISAKSQLAVVVACGYTDALVEEFVDIMSFRVPP